MKRPAQAASMRGTRICAPVKGLSNPEVWHPVGRRIRAHSTSSGWVWGGHVLESVKPKNFFQRPGFNRV